eukprot:gene12478-8918_t
MVSAVGFSTTQRLLLLLRQVPQWQRRQTELRRWLHQVNDRPFVPLNECADALVTFSARARSFAVRIRDDCLTAAVEAKLCLAYGPGLLTHEGYLVTAARLQAGEYVYDASQPVDRSP